MNILSFDIEEWFFEKGGVNNDWKFDQLNEMLDRILLLLQSKKISATFFCLGEMAIDFPDVIKKIASFGHEIGCHSMKHHWVNKMSSKEFYKDTQTAMEVIEKIIDNKVISYRSPAFSITEKSKWAFDILADLGIKNDASIFPTSRDFGGYKGYPAINKPSKIILDKGASITEFPINITRLPIINKEIAYSGGGYFRLLPLSFIKKRISNSEYTMCYFHLGDLVDYETPLMSKKEYEDYFKEPGTLKNRYLRYFKSNIGRTRAFKGLKDLINSYDFISVKEAAKSNINFQEISL